LSRHFAPPFGKFENNDIAISNVTPDDFADSVHTLSSSFEPLQVKKRPITPMIRSVPLAFPIFPRIHSGYILYFHHIMLSSENKRFFLLTTCFILTKSSIFLVFTH